jgi:alkylation response protein AidB-like acyl-CoA dehydrogenase
VSTDVNSAQDRISPFVRDVIRPIAAAMAAGRGPAPKDIVAAAGEAGLAGLLTPRTLRGAGGSHQDFAAFIEAVARVDASSAVILDVHLSVGTEPILVYGNNDQKERYLPRLASGEWLAGFALTEPSGGSDAASLQTRALRNGDHYRVSGTKSFITSAGQADLYVVMARTGKSPREISAFLVEAGWPGVSAGRPLDKMGLHGSWTGELIFEDVRVPIANLLGDEGDGFRIALATLDSGRVGIAAQAVGIAQGALDASIDAAKQRRAQGVEVDEVALAEMESRTTAARLLTRHAAAMVDAGERVTREASTAKLYASDVCVAVAHAAVELCAPDSAVADHPAAVRLRDAKASQIYEGTNQVQRVVIARELLG